MNHDSDAEQEINDQREVETFQWVYEGGTILKNVRFIHIPGMLPHNLIPIVQFLPRL